MIYLVLINYSVAQLPYSKKIKYKKKSEGAVPAKMIDDLGLKYYLVTDSLIPNDLNDDFYSSGLPRLLLKGAYQMSKNIISSTSDTIKNSKSINAIIPFYEIRKQTLLNLKQASKNLVNTKEPLLFLNWEDFIKSIALADAYCDQLILFREKIGNPFIPKNNSTSQTQYQSKTFDKKRGADGLTTVQWMRIMRRGGGRYAHDTVRKYNKKNQRALVELKKQERGSIEVGKLEIVKESSNIIDGLKYVHSTISPKQLSFLYSNDSELIEGIVDWIIYINSGNTIKLSEMFRVGLDVSFFNDTNENISLVDHSYRDIMDKNENQVRLEFSEKHFDEINFSDIKIKHVTIKNTQIQFFGETDNSNDLYLNGKQIVIILKNIEGDLLDRIKANINQTRAGLNDYDDTIMNLSKY